MFYIGLCLFVCLHVGLHECMYACMQVFTCDPCRNANNVDSLQVRRQAVAIATEEELGKHVEGGMLVVGVCV